MSIFNNPAVKYNYEEGNGVTLSSFNEPTSIISSVISGSSKISQKNVEGLEESLANLTNNILLGEEKLNALENDYEGFTILQTEINCKNLKEIKQIRDDIKFFNNSQADLNEKFADHIRKLIKESMIMFFMIILLFVIDLATIWFIIRK